MTEAKKVQKISGVLRIGQFERTFEDELVARYEIPKLPDGVVPAHWQRNGPHPPGDGAARYPQPGQLSQQRRAGNTRTARTPT